MVPQQHRTREAREQAAEHRHHRKHRHHLPQRPAVVAAHKRHLFCAPLVCPALCCCRCCCFHRACVGSFVPLFPFVFVLCCTEQLSSRLCTFFVALVKTSTRHSSRVFLMGLESCIMVDQSLLHLWIKTCGQNEKLKEALNKAQKLRQKRTAQQSERLKRNKTKQ